MKPRSIVFDLFGEYLSSFGGAARMQTLSELLGVFGIEEATARITLARMRREGWFVTKRTGRQSVYSLSEKGWRLLSEGKTRIFREAPERWDGKWRMVVYTLPKRSNQERDQLRKDLAWLGFGLLTSSTWVSPHARLVEARELMELHQSTWYHLFTCRSRSREEDLDIVARCWDLDTLAKEYEAFTEELSKLPTPGELRELPGSAALKLQVEINNRYRKFPFKDPDLPRNLLPNRWPGARARVFFDEVHKALHDPAEKFVRALLSGATSEST